HVIRSRACMLGVIHGLSRPPTDWAAPLRRPPVVEIEHDIMRRVREWMVGGRLPPGISSARARRSHGEANVTGIRVLPRRRSSILRQLCNCLSYSLGSKKEISRQTA